MRVLNLIENPKRVVEIGERREMEDSAMEEEGVWVCGRCGAQCVSVYLLELRHVRTLVQQVEKMGVEVGA